MDMTKRKSYPRDKPIILVGFEHQFPFVSGEILKQPSIFEDHKGFIRYLPDMIVDTPNSWM
jgi:hypothetical protein